MDLRIKMCTQFVVISQTLKIADSSDSVNKKNKKSGAQILPLLISMPKNSTFTSTQIDISKLANLQRLLVTGYFENVAKYAGS
jgi:ACT domain-containing protein